jgi:hypothetical protein
MNISGWSQDDGSPVIEWGCNGAANELWYYQSGAGGGYQLVSHWDGKCLAVAGSYSGAKLVQEDCSYGDYNESWYYNVVGYDVYGNKMYNIRSAAKYGQCIDLTNFGNNGWGTQLQTWSCSGGWNQLGE